jgi:hypothetical protein
MYSWRLRPCLKWITITILMAIIAKFDANQCVKRVYEPIGEGQSCNLFRSCGSFGYLVGAPKY